MKLRTLLKCCAFLAFFLFIRVGHAEDQRPRDLKVYQEFFKDTLLVIYYANPHYETIDFIKSLYSSVFKNIVFCGDRTEFVDIGEADHENEDGDHGKLRIVYTRNGYYLSKWIKDVLETYPSYSGYIFMQDDVLLQFWNFLSFDKNKIWFAHNSLETVNPYSLMDRFIVNHVDAPVYDWWFNTLCGMPEIKKILPQLSRKERAFLAANFGENAVAGQNVDFFYIPKRLSEHTIRLCYLFSRVWCEIAIPNMLGCMDYMTNWENTLPYFWICHGNYADRAFAAYRPEFFWFHACKHSLEEHRNFARRIFNEQFYDTLDE